MVEVGRRCCMTLTWGVEKKKGLFVLLRVLETEERRFGCVREVRSSAITYRNFKRRGNRFGASCSCYSHSASVLYWYCDVLVL